MEIKQSTQQQKIEVPKTVIWTAIPSCVLAFIFSCRLWSILAQGQGGHEGFISVEAVQFFGTIFFFFLFSFAIWTPVLCGALIICTAFRIGMPYYSQKAWILFLILLLPFYESMNVLLDGSTFHLLIYSHR